VPDLDTQAHWDGVAARRLLIQQCHGCGLWVWQPKPLCPRCRQPDPVWTEVTGAGRVTSWTVVHPPVLPVWAETVPFVILLVELSEGVRLVGQLTDAAGERVHTDEGVQFDVPVRLTWRTDEAGQVLPAWALAG
jgi:uncharacterized OB-fold protein